MAAHFPPFTKPSQEPTGAYRSTEVVSDTESRLRTALSYVNHARDLILAELDQPTGCDSPIQPAERTAKQAYDEQTRRDVWWSERRGDYVTTWHATLGRIPGANQPMRDELPPNLAVAIKPPLEPTRLATPAELAEMRATLTREELRGLGIGDVEPRHPMRAEADRLIGPEDTL